jgi:uncharacterized Ntn-hydrolase superfamily protein
VASQAFSERSYGPLGLELMRNGKTPEQALAALRAVDPLAETRQVAMLGADGAVAVFTGADCIPAAGHLTGEGVSAQANCVESPAVWESMVEAFRDSSGSLARRLFAALEAAEAAGGDWRGRQAAGIRVVPAEGRPWETVCDLRVDDHPDPLAELERLLRLHEGYSAMGEVDDSAAIAKAAGMSELDLHFARILDAARAGDIERGRTLVAELVARDQRWRSFLEAMRDLDELPHGDELLAEG